MIDHVGIAVANYERSRAFFTAALAPLGYEVLVEKDGQIGFGREGRARLWITNAANTTRPVHLAISARSEAEVRDFHAAAIAAGAEDDGGPAMKFDGAGDYFGASVRDAEDRKIEAVFREA
jgi:catechol 2,3-dioxygenase-like lactoylglutathione lyase family enzyme